MTLSYFYRTILLAVILSVGIYIQVHGQEGITRPLRTDTTVGSSDIKELLKIQPERSEPTVFSASRQAQKLSDAPATIYLITAQEIQTRGYLNLKHVLEDIPEFKFDEFGDPRQFNIVTVRGVRGTEKFIILLDGVRISSPTNEILPIVENFPVRNIKQIEIITSASSAIYGADAMTGIINIISYKGEEINGLRMGIYGGTHDYFSSDFIFGKKIKKFDFRLTGSFAYDGQPNLPHFYQIEEYKDLGSLRTGEFNTGFGPRKTTQPLSPEYGASIHSYNYEAAVSYQDLTFSFHQNYCAAPSFMSYTSNNAVYNDNIDLAPRISRAALTYRKNFQKLSNTTILSYGIYEMTEGSAYRNVYSDMQFGYKYGYGNLFQLDEQLAYTFSEKFNLSAGLNIQSFASAPIGDDLEAPFNPDVAFQAQVRGAPFNAEFAFLRFFNYGTYAQAIWKPVPKFIITGGLRYDQNTRFRGVVNPRLGLTYKVTPTASVKLFYGESFLAPSPFQTYQRFGSFFSTDEGNSYQSAFYHVPNPDLQPVKLRSLELSYYQAIGGLKINFTAYHMWLNDLYYDQIFSDSTATIYGWPVDAFEKSVNLGRQRNYGFSLMANQKVEFKKNYQLNVYGGIGFIDGEEAALPGAEKQNDVEIAYVSPFQFRFGSDWLLGRFSLSLRTTAMNAQRTQAVDRYDGPRNEGIRKTLPGYMVFHVNAGFQATKNLRFSLQIQNATDQRYRNVNTLAGVNSVEMFGVPQNPIRIIFGLQLNL